MSERGSPSDDNGNPRTRVEPDRGADSKAAIDDTIGDDTRASLNPVAQGVAHRIVVGDGSHAAEGDGWVFLRGGDANVDQRA